MTNGFETPPPNLCCCWIVSLTKNEQHLTSWLVTTKLRVIHELAENHSLVPHEPTTSPSMATCITITQKRRPKPPQLPMHLEAKLCWKIKPLECHPLSNTRSLEHLQRSSFKSIRDFSFNRVFQAYKSWSKLLYHPKFLPSLPFLSSSSFDEEQSSMQIII